MEKIDLAYLAGLIDGEGYIGIKLTRRKDARSPIYHERIQVRMVHEQAIAFLARRLGGNYYLERPHSAQGRSLYCWQASDALAAKILASLLPFLRVKRTSALTVLRLRKSKADPRARRRGSPARRTMLPSIVAFRHRLYLKAKSLNH